MVNAVWCQGTLEQITSLQELAMLQAAHAIYGSAPLGIEPSKIGTHSLCLGAAIEMYLAGVPVFTIMLIGRWSSNAFKTDRPKRAQREAVDG